MATLAYLQARLAAQYTLLEAMESTTIGQYITDNSGVRQQVTYRAIEEVRNTIDWLEQKIAAKSPRRYLGVKRSMLG